MGTTEMNIMEITSVHADTEQDLIIITEDKMQLVLNKHLGVMENKQRWIAPFGVFITILVTILTASFKDFFFTSAEWRAIFGIGLLLTFGILIYFIIIALESKTPEDIIDILKRGSKKIL